MDTVVRLDEKPYPAHLPSTALLILAETERDLSAWATPACVSVHNALLQHFPSWDADQRWFYAHIFTEAAGVESGIPPEVV